jgi:hypothetical protein
MADEFAIDVPQHALSTILSRATNKGLVTKRLRRYHPQQAVLAQWPLPASRSDLPRCVAALARALVDFARNQFCQELNPEVAEDALDRYIASCTVSLALMTRSTATSPVVQPVPDASLEVVIASFIDHVATREPTLFQHIEALVQGNMLTSALYLSDPGSIERKFRATTLYLDTPFLLELVDCKGAAFVAPARELVELAKRNGARVACFERTLMELTGVIQGTTMPSGKYWRANNDVAIYFAEKGLRPADIELKAGQLKPELAKLGISVLSAPKYEASLSVDEDALRAELDKRISYVRDTTRDHDVDALTAVHRLRGGRTPPILEESRAIFVTKNESVVNAARSFFHEGGGLAWPPALLDVDLATLLWVKRPSEAPDLPRKRVLADCYAALRPTPALWNQCLDEIGRLAAKGEISEADVELMRLSPEAQRTLMRRTLGDPKALTAQVATDSLNAARLAAQQPVIIELREEQARLVRSKIDTTAAQNEAEELRRSQQALIETALRQADEQRWGRIRLRAKRHAHRVAKVLR